MYLTGPLPPTVTALTQLQALRMGNNFLAGQLPPLQGAYSNRRPAPCSTFSAASSRAYEPVSAFDFGATGSVSVTLSRSSSLDPL